VCTPLLQWIDEAGKLNEDHQQIQGVVSVNDSAEMRSLLGEVEEKARNHLSSAAQHEQAARMEPSGQNILNWGGGSCCSTRHLLLPSKGSKPARTLSGIGAVAQWPRDRILQRGTDGPRRGHFFPI
jgi:hypothetical protein